MKKHRSKRKTFIISLLFIVMGISVASSEPAIEFQMPTDVRFEWKEQKILLSRLVRSKKPYEFYRTSPNAFEVISLVGDQVHRFFEFGKGSLYRCSDVDDIRMVDILEREGGAAALFEVEGHYFIMRSSKRPPTPDKGQIYIRRQSLSGDCWHSIYLVRLTNSEYNSVDFDCDPRKRIPEVGKIWLSSLNTVRLKFFLENGELDESVDYSITPASGNPKFSESGRVKLIKNGVESGTSVMGSSSITDEDNIVRLFNDKNISSAVIREMVIETAGSKEGFFKMMLPIRDKEKLAAVMNRVEVAFSEDD